MRLFQTRKNIKLRRSVQTWFPYEQANEAYKCKLTSFIYCQEFITYPNHLTCFSRGKYFILKNLSTSFENVVIDIKVPPMAHGMLTQGRLQKWTEHSILTVSTQGPILNINNVTQTHLIFVKLRKDHFRHVKGKSMVIFYLLCQEIRHEMVV